MTKTATHAELLAMGFVYERVPQSWYYGEPDRSHYTHPDGRKATLTQQEDKTYLFEERDP